MKAITKVVEGSVARIALHGEHDVSTAHELSRALVESAVPGIDLVVVDVAGCTFADSTALGALVGGYKRMLAQDGEFVVINENGALQKLLEITKLDGLLLAPPGFDR